MAKLLADTGVIWDLNGKVLMARADSGIVAGPSDHVDNVALAFLSKYRDIFDITDPASDLVLNHKQEQMPGGMALAFFDQREAGVPVYRAHVSAIFNAHRHLTTVGSGYIAGAHGVSPVPGLPPSAADTAARADAHARFHLPNSATLIVTDPKLIFYPTGQAVRLAYQVSVGSTGQGLPFSAKYFIDANTGSVLYAENDVADSSPPTLPPPYSETAYPVGAERSDSGLGSIPSTPAQSFNSYLTGAIPGGPRNRYFYSYMQSLYPTNPMPNGGILAPEYAWNGASNSEISGSVRYLPQDASTWDAQAVDAYTNIYWANYWWNNDVYMFVPFTNATAMVVNVHEPGQANQALWAGTGLDQFFTFDSAPVTKGVTQFPFSVARDILGHEYWHSVNDVTLMLSTTSGEEAVLNESLGDIFGNYVENDLPPSSYSPVIWTLGEGAVGPGDTSSNNYVLRNLKDPHQSGPGTGPQADNLHDPMIPWVSDPHIGNGVPNNAWYLSLFGGTNTTSQISVPAATAVGYATAELLYNLAVTGQVVPVTNLLSFAENLATLSLAGWGPPEATAAIACAWYAVGVMSPEEALDRFDVSSCQCANVPDGTYCGQKLPTPGQAGVIGAQNTLYKCVNQVLVNAEACPSTAQCTPNGNGNGIGNATCNDPGFCTKISTQYGEPALGTWCYNSTSVEIYCNPVYPPSENGQLLGCIPITTCLPDPEPQTNGNGHCIGTTACTLGDPTPCVDACAPMSTQVPCPSPSTTSCEPAGDPALVGASAILVPTYANIGDVCP